jgi:hypothetical protein
VSFRRSGGPRECKGPSGQEAGNELRTAGRANEVRSACCLVLGCPPKTALRKMALAARALREAYFTPMEASVFQDIKDALRRLNIEDGRPWLVGFSGGKACPERSERDTGLLASLPFDAAIPAPPEHRSKPLSVL